MFYLSTESVVESFTNLKRLEFSNESILHIFFILKACGFNELEPKPISDIRDYGLEPGVVIGSLFGRNEKLPDKYSFINPFKLSTWSSQPSEPLNLWVRTRSVNNITGGARSWRKIVDYDADEETLKLTYNYMENLKELTFQDTHIDLQAFALWTARFSGFEDQKPSKYELIKSMQSYFHLSDTEMLQLFKNISDIPLTYADHEFDTSAIRRMIRPDNVGDEWVDSEYQHDEQNTVRRNYMETAHVTRNSVQPEKIAAALDRFNNIMLSGPPATSKSFLAKAVSGSYAHVESIQFHPEYTYQDFIGGYFVQGESVMFQEGVLTSLSKRAVENPEQRFLLIIDEVNRGNLSSILGETIQALDRNYTTNVKIGAESFELRIPKNLHILATRNTTDKSLANIDLAVYRRFIDFRIAPNPDVLSDLVEIEGGISARDLLHKINKNLLQITSDEDLQVGHALFLQESVRGEDGKYRWSKNDFEILFVYSLLPLIKEYCQGSSDTVTQLFGSSLLHAIGTDGFIQAVNDFTMID